MRQLIIILCAVLLASVFQAPAQAEEAVARPKKARPRVVTKAAEKPSLNEKDLDAPYSVMQRQDMGPPRELAGDAGTAQGKAQPNVTSWKVEPSLTVRPKAKDSPVQFLVGGEKVVDPITGKEVTPRADPLGTRENLKDLGLKDALGKLRGKAEVQVDLLKF